jgi:hypothetical protein
MSGQLQHILISLELIVLTYIYCPIGGPSNSLGNWIEAKVL